MGPQKKSCASFPGKGRKKWTHINIIGGIFGIKKGVSNGSFSATKSLVYCFFLEDRFLYSGTDSLDNSTAEVSASAPVVYKNPPMGPEILYTTGAGEGVKVSVAIFPPAVVVYKILSLIFPALFGGHSSSTWPQIVMFVLSSFRRSASLALPHKFRRRSPNSTRTPMGFTENPSRGSPERAGGGKGGGGGGVCVEFGERARPLYREKTAPFR